MGDINEKYNDNNKSAISSQQPIIKFIDTPKIVKEEKKKRRNNNENNNNKSNNNNNDKHEMGRLWSIKKFGKKHYYEYIVSLSIFFYWTLVSIIPIYNKIFFQKKYYPYPIATAGIQLFVVSTISIIIN